MMWRGFSAMGRALLGGSEPEAPEGSGDAELVAATAESEAASEPRYPTATPPPPPLPKQKYEYIHIPPEHDSSRFHWVKRGPEEWSVKHYPAGHQTPDFSFLINGNAVAIKKPAGNPWDIQQDNSAGPEPEDLSRSDYFLHCGLVQVVVRLHEQKIGIRGSDVRLLNTFAD